MDNQEQPSRRSIFCMGARALAARPLFALSAAALLALSSAASASPWPTQPATESAIRVTPSIGQGNVALYGLGRLDSAPGESKVDFLKRVGRSLAEFTEQTGFEACAPIGENVGLGPSAGRWVAVMMTNGSHIACTNDPSWLGATTDTGETIHSHPATTAKVYRVNEADQMLLHAITSARVPRGKMMRYPGTHRHDAPFSPQDMAAGPGWLVSDGELFHQDGQTSVSWGSIALSSSPDHPGVLALSGFSTSAGRNITFWDPARFNRVDTPSATPTQTAPETQMAVLQPRR